MNMTYESARCQWVDASLGCGWKERPLDILNKQSRAVGKEWYSKLGFGREANNSSPLKLTRFKMPQRGPDSNGFFGTTKQNDMRFGTSNIMALQGRFI
jgi:hypothetical protein